MGKTRRNSNTNSGRTSHDAATSTNLMNNQFAKNPMHTREQGQSSLMSMIDGMMDNMDGFVEKMDGKVGSVFGGGVNPAKATFHVPDWDSNGSSAGASYGAGGNGHQPSASTKPSGSASRSSRYWPATTAMGG